MRRHSNDDTRIERSMEYHRLDFLFANFLFASHVACEEENVSLNSVNGVCHQYNQQMDDFAE